MKPRNKFEKAVLEQSKHLCPITKTQSKWAFRECIDHFAYRLPKGRTTCMDCGHSWVMDKHRETCTCPHCRARKPTSASCSRSSISPYLPLVESFKYYVCSYLSWVWRKVTKHRLQSLRLGNIDGIYRDEKLWLLYRGYWDTMLIHFLIIVLWRYATIMKPISILPTHRYIRSSRLHTYSADLLSWQQEYILCFTV